MILNSTVIVDILNSFKTELDKSVEKNGSVCPVLKAVNEHSLLENEQKAAKKTIATCNENEMTAPSY